MPVMLFVRPHQELSDKEIAEVLRQSIAIAGRLPRHAAVFLAGICAEHLVDELSHGGIVGGAACGVAIASLTEAMCMG